MAALPRKRSHTQTYAHTHTRTHTGHCTPLPFCCHSKCSHTHTIENVHGAFTDA
jgi:hypothetical protein